MYENATMITVPEKNGRSSTVIKIYAKLHKRVWLYMQNYRNHIEERHPEMTIEKIIQVLSEPDEVYKPSKRSKEFYYQATIDGIKYRVILGHHDKKVKSIITAYAVSSEYVTWHEGYCCYWKEDPKNTKNWNKWVEDFSAEYGQLLLIEGA